MKNNIIALLLSFIIISLVTLTSCAFTTDFWTAVLNDTLTTTVPIVDYDFNDLDWNETGADLFYIWGTTPPLLVNGRLQLNIHVSRSGFIQLKNTIGANENIVIELDISSVGTGTDGGVVLIKEPNSTKDDFEMNSPDRQVFAHLSDTGHWNINNSNTTVTDPGSNRVPGEEEHIKIEWRDTGLKLYRNGTLMLEEQLNDLYGAYYNIDTWYYDVLAQAAYSTGFRFEIGADSLNTTTYIDNLKIYKVP